VVGYYSATRQHNAAAPLADFCTAAYKTSYAVVKLLHGRVFLLAAGGFLGGYDEETLRSLLMVAKKHDIQKILTEPNFGGGMFTKLLQGAAQRHYHQCGVEDGEWSTNMKEARIIDTLEPVMNQHKLVVCQSVVQTDYDSVLKYDGDRAPYYRLFYQMGRMVREKGALSQDDRIDAVAAAVGHYTKALARDSERASLQAKEDAFDRELEKFMNHALGFGVTGAGATKGRPMASSILRPPRPRAGRLV
jgi:hypothetical protein